jgi:hypothetical protein
VAGYSGTPLPRKLGIEESYRIAVVNGPKSFPKALGKLPAGVELKTDLRGSRPFDILVLFAPSRKVLVQEFARMRPKLAGTGGLWVAWPKKASGVETDLTEDVVRDIGLAEGLVDNKVCAIDETWSGLRFVIRLRNRFRSP